MFASSRSSEECLLRLMLGVEYEADFDYDPEKQAMYGRMTVSVQTDGEGCST